MTRGRLFSPFIFYYIWNLFELNPVPFFSSSNNLIILKFRWLIIIPFDLNPMGCFFFLFFFLPGSTTQHPNRWIFCVFGSLVTLTIQFHVDSFHFHTFGKLKKKKTIILKLKRKSEKTSRYHVMKLEC